MGGRPRRMEKRCDTAPVMFWHTGLTTRTECWGVRHPLTSTGVVRIYTGKTE